MILAVVLYPFVLQTCIDRWAVTKPSCPVCRTSFAAVALEGSSAVPIDANLQRSGAPQQSSTVSPVSSRVASGNSAESSWNASSGASATEERNRNNGDIVATWTPVSCYCLEDVPLHVSVHLFDNELSPGLSMRLLDPCVMSYGFLRLNLLLFLCLPSQLMSSIGSMFYNPISVHRF